MQPVLKVQEITFDDPESCNHFQPSAEKPFVATPAAIEAYSHDIIIRCLAVLQDQAKRYDGIDRLQVFTSPEAGKPDLWIIEDGDGGAITALLPTDY